MQNTHSFKMNLPEMSDPVDVRELNDNFLVIDDALMAGLCKKELTTNNMGSSDPASRKYGWAPWIEIYNGNEFDVVVIDRNAPDLPSGTINIEAGKTHRMFINGTYYMNFYVQDQHEVTFKWFTNAETRINEIEPSGGGGVSSVNVTGASGSHIESSGGPITDSGTIELSISEGYSIPQTNKQTAWDSKAADLKLEINSSTFVITAQLKDASGNLIGNERTIDLPLESVVVSGTYDDQTKKVILTLQNGSTIEFSVADLVSGLQTELSASNTLDPDYIDYDASHRAVSDTEKNTWNSKQNAISDLETIRSGAAAGATAVQPGTMSTALALKQDSLSETQLAAVNSGINSTKVDQIETNKTNILLVQDATEELVDKGAKNIIDIQTPDESLLTSYTSTANGGVALTINNAARTSYRVKFSTIINTAYVCKILVDSAPTTDVYVFIQNSSGGNYTGGAIKSNTTELIREFTATETAWGRLTINLNNEGTPLTNAITVRVMICTKADWKISQNYVPFALPNTDLTRMMTPFFTVPINHNMIYRGQNLGETFTDAQDAALSSGNFTDLYLGDYWTKTVTILAGTYTGGDGEEVTVPAQTNITLKAVIADFDAFYAGYASSYAGINTHHAAVIVTGFSNVAWNKTNSTAGGYVASLIHKWLVGSALPQIETWFGSAKVLSPQKLLTNAITGDAASGWAWSPQKISLLSENQMYGSKVWGNSKAANGGYEPGEAFKHLNVFNHIDANLLFGNKNIWLRDIASAGGVACLSSSGRAADGDASATWIAPAALILLS